MNLHGVEVTLPVVLVLFDSKIENKAIRFSINQFVLRVYGLVCVLGYSGIIVLTRNSQ
jgi:hypothetical protein